MMMSSLSEFCSLCAVFPTAAAAAATRLAVHKSAAAWMDEWMNGWMNVGFACRYTRRRFTTNALYE